MEEVRTYLDRGKYVTSLDVVMVAGEGSSVMEMIKDPADPDGTLAMEQSELRETVDALEAALNVLTPKEREYVQRKWGLHGRPEETFMDLGKEAGLSRERIRQVVDTAQRKMKRYLLMRQPAQQSVQGAEPVGALR